MLHKVPSPHALIEHLNNWAFPGLTAERSELLPPHALGNFSTAFSAAYRYRQQKVV